jgi:hypothetical protein
MTNSEPENGTTRYDLIQRLALMETMIAEGRRTTTRCGWIFVLWGLVDIAGMGWQWVWESYWVWPITIVTGLVIQFSIILVLRRKSGSVCASNSQDRTISAIWSMMGLATTLYVATGIYRHLAWQYSFIAAIFMIVGLAHAISAMVLRWRAQGLVAALWWAGGIAMFFAHSPKAIFVVFPLEMFFGMVLFGLYAMMLERRDGGGRGSTNA